MDPEDKLARTSEAAAETRAALAETAREAETAARVMQAAFAEAGGEISRVMESAARSGAASFNEMAEDILQALARIALEQFVFSPLGGLADQLAGSLGRAIGARAQGGPVMAGAGYLVGERGPEVFTPNAAGSVAPLSAPSVTVNIVAPAGEAATAVRRSERQIAAAVARAVREGSRSL